MRGLHDAPIERPQFLWNDIVRYLSCNAVVKDVIRGDNHWRYKLYVCHSAGRRFHWETIWVPQALVSKL